MSSRADPLPLSPQAPFKVQQLESAALHRSRPSPKTEGSQRHAHAGKVGAHHGEGPSSCRTWSSTSLHGWHSGDHGQTNAWQNTAGQDSTYAVQAQDAGTTTIGTARQGSTDAVQAQDAGTGPHRHSKEAAHHTGWTSPPPLHATYHNFQMTGHLTCRVHLGTTRHVLTPQSSNRGAQSWCSWPSLLAALRAKQSPAAQGETQVRTCGA